LVTFIWAIIFLFLILAPWNQRVVRVTMTVATCSPCYQLQLYKLVHGFTAALMTFCFTLSCCCCCCCFWWCVVFCCCHCVVFQSHQFCQHCIDANYNDIIVIVSANCRGSWRRRWVWAWISDKATFFDTSNVRFYTANKKDSEGSFQIPRDASPSIVVTTYTSIIGWTHHCAAAATVDDRDLDSRRQGRSGCLRC